MKKSFIAFLVFVLYVFAVLYGLGWGLLGGLYQVLPVVLFLGAIAFPKFKGSCKAIFGKDK